MKKVKQSYWKLKPSKVPIWKQRNDDSRLGMHSQAPIVQQPVQVSRPSMPAMPSQSMPAMPKSSLPYNPGVAHPAPSYQAPKGIPAPIPIPKPNLPSNPYKAVPMPITPRNPNYSKGIPVRPMPLPPTRPIQRPSGRPEPLPIRKGVKPSLY